MILDEFYSHYIYTNSTDAPCKLVSAAAFVEDVETDPVIVVDGLTKNWRYPGWRISWILGPKSVVETVASAGSFLDGGANHPFQKEALLLLDPSIALQETIAIQKHFAEKRQYTLDRLKEMGIGVDAEPEGTFYVWANLSNLPPPLNNGMSFFKEGLKEKVITVLAYSSTSIPTTAAPMRATRTIVELALGGDEEAYHWIKRRRARYSKVQLAS